MLLLPRNLPHALAILLTALLVASAQAPARAATPMQECWVTENTNLDAPQLQRAIAACSLMLKDTSMPNEARAGTYLHRGVARRRLGEIAEALGDLLAAKQYAPTDAGIARMLAWTYRELERPADSEAESILTGRTTPRAAPCTSTARTMPAAWRIAAQPPSPPTTRISNTSAASPWRG
jgi:hypothetical protein